MVEAEHTSLLALHSLDSLTQEFALFPKDDTTEPVAGQWADYLRQNPEYVDTGYYKAAARYFAEGGRQTCDGLDENRQRLAGTLIRITFDDEQLIQMGHQI